MKIRYGFVSNSSSSSFIAIGAKFKNLTDAQQEACENAGVETHWVEYANETGYIVGEEIACWNDEDDSGLSILTIQELTNTIEEVQRGLNKVFGPDKETAKIFYGIRAS